MILYAITILSLCIIGFILTNKMNNTQSEEQQMTLEELNYTLDWLIMMNIITSDEYHRILVKALPYIK